MNKGSTTHDVRIDRNRGIVVKSFRDCRRGEARDPFRWLFGERVENR